MTLREQILMELNEQNSIAQAEIKKCEDDISTQTFLMSTVNGGALAGAARSACEARKQAAADKKSRIATENVWVSEMLSKYK